MKYLLSCLFVLLASSASAQTFPCTVAEKVGTYANGDKKIGLRCPAATPAVKGDALTVTPPTPSATTWRPVTSAALTDALAKAQGGDTIILSAGTTYAGSFRLPVHPGSDYVTVRTSATLPERRLTDADGALLATLISTTAGSPTITTAPGAHHWRLIGIRVDATSNTYGRIRCGSADGYTDRAQVPHHVEFDRIVLTVPDTLEERRGIMTHCDDLVIRRSIVTGMHETGADSQAIGGWEGTSRIRIEDNDISAASEPVLFGGGASSQATPVPEDIEILNNHISKPLTWLGKPWNLKNLLELKNARRVRIAGNTIENNWPAAQTGWSILFTARGAVNAPWMVLEDVTFEQNTVRNVAAGINILGLDDTPLPVPMVGHRFTIRNNLIVTNKNLLGTDGDGRCYMLLGGPAGVVIDHNTCINDGTAVLAVDKAASLIPGFRFTNNLQLHGLYGIFGGGVGTGLPALAFFDQPVVTANVFAGGAGNPYPAGNLFPTVAEFLSQFVNPSAGDYRLTETSSYRKAGIDGKDLGAELR